MTAPEFAKTFERPAQATWRAPGRVNVIGEHTDYNEGFVLPMALPLGVTASVAARTDGRLRAISVSMTERADLAVADLAPRSHSGWAAYVAGVVWALRRAGHDVPGVDVLVDGDVPAGAGLSSSAALECSVAGALDDAFGFGLGRDELVSMARAAENDYVGVPTGMLDQSASMLCTEGAALLLDCRSYERRQVPLDLGAAGLRLLVIDVGAPHRHADGEYAKRRADCETAARELGVPALRDIDLEQLAPALGRLADERLRRRVRHVVTEDARVAEAVRRLDSGDLVGLGPLLTSSHASLRDDYEVSSRELDVAVDAALAAGAHGARMTGGGFGGSAIALVDADHADEVGRLVTARFADDGLGTPRIFPAVPSPGAHRVA